jgi:VIT1/CCC1 family predicted Fe2+/Mn2+ transporter
MAFSEGLSDTGELTGRGSPYGRGAITGLGTFIGGILHSLPFLIPTYHAAIVTASVVVAFELLALAALRSRFFNTSFTTSLAAVSLAGAIIVAVSVTLGATA